ncbi:glycosyltransferase [Dysgonomonas sp. 511]|uniref:glycosyltransferase n=1 Tax=Dysgonomonas sp. 511 TaxID=2302930 RepID=UPI0013D45416|nr:glycosyltransferase [Dysgonomonas sp. 511]NDV78859.1 glycosyltransferase [Dysgonomonas sp. 511]
MKELINFEPLVSIIVPIYNVIKFIDRGINNILSQTYANLEILLIDDGSTDGSGELCDYWSVKEERIKVYHKKNGGAGSARNLGMSKASGKYIYFFDIDDLADKELLDYNVRIMEEKQVDFILFGFSTIEVGRNNIRDEITFVEQEIHSNEELKQIYVDTILLTKNGNGFPWNKFYRRSFLEKHNIIYEDQRIQQDEVFNLKLYLYLEKAYISQKILYTYFIYNIGNTRSHFIEDRFDIYVSVRSHFENLCNYWKLEDSRYDEYLNKRFYNSVEICINFNMFHKDCIWNTKEKKKELKRIMEHCYTKDAISFVEEHKYLNRERRLYLYAYKIQKLFLVRIYNYFFHIARLVKKFI